MTFAKAAGLVALAAAAGTGYAALRISRPYAGFEGETFVEFPRGASAVSMADSLAAAGVVRSRWDFLLVRLLERSRILQAGDYRFVHAASPKDIFDRIARGDVFYYELTVPEGWNMFDIAAALEQMGRFPASRFLAAARDPSSIRDLDPKAPTLEGYLFPSTYRFGRHTTPEQFCEMMTGKFREEWRSLGTNADPHATVTEASLVEKESKLPPERPLIAQVFLNRLRLGMKLDCDSTTIYAAMLEERYRGTIYRSDLESVNSYNTYRHAGLPPGPIANPGLASIGAVLAPEPTDALYFVLRPDGSGSHQFSTTIAAHEAATAKYRRGLRR
jgi:UPF0755 protein